MKIKCIESNVNASIKHKSRVKNNTVVHPDGNNNLEQNADVYEFQRVRPRPFSSIDSRRKYVARLISGCLFKNIR